MSFDMHLKFTGGKLTIEGSSAHSKHTKEIPILAWSWSASNTGDLHGGNTTSGGKANVQDISITKYVDSCSNVLLNAVCTGARMDSAVLYVTNAVGDQTDFLTLTLSEGVLITSWASGGSDGEDKLTENITLHFGKFEFAFQPQTAEGAANGGQKTFVYDMQTVLGKTT
jgi:type VI secretion system secreted protein Hcp